MSKTSYTDLEREVIVLKAMTEMIDGMVNYEIFGRLKRTRNMNLMFNTITHQRLFNVLLVDMLSKPTNDHFGLLAIPEDASESTKTFLFYLRHISENPIFNTTGTALADPVETFATWLDGECHLENVWLPSINIETTIRVSRISFIKMCGNISKHSFPRLSGNARQLRNLLAENGHQISIEQAYLAMPEFYEWFHDDIFAYHGSTIGEFLNNIRWGIYDYLTPEFARSYKKPDAESRSHNYDVPDECNSDLGRWMNWELMGWTSSEPFMPKFEVTESLKKRY